MIQNLETNEDITATAGAAADGPNICFTDFHRIIKSAKTTKKFHGAWL